MQFRQDIQGLRAVAVLAVIVFHLNPAWLPGGFVGVDIFMVISGFLIGSILLHKKCKADYSPIRTVGYFYSSRAQRIVPAYFGTLIVVSLLAAVLFLPEDFSIFKEGLRKALWFNSNNYFANFGDYFAPANHEQPLLHTWSLAVEIQFYLIAPFIFLLVPKRLLSWLLPLGIVICTAIAEYKLRMGIEQAIYFSLLGRLPAFFLGGWASLHMSNRSGGKNQGVWLTLLAFSLILLAVVWPRATGFFPGLAGLIPAVAAGLLIWNNAQNKLTAILSCKTMVWIGTLSYSLYLWHWPVLAFMRYYAEVEILNWQYTFGFIGLTLILASISYHWLETPLRFKKNWRQGVGGYASLFLGTVVTLLSMTRVNTNFTPKPLPIEYKRYADSKTICHGQILDNCLKGDLSSEKEVLVLGDSHAAMLNDFFDFLGKELGFKARIITASSCVTIPDFDYQRIAEWAHKPCLSQIEEAQKYIPDAKVIFIAALWNWQLESKSFKGSLESFIVNQSDKEIVIMLQEPLLLKNPIRSNRFNFIGLPIRTSLNYEFKKANKYLQSYQNKRNVVIVDPNGLDVFTNIPIYKGELLYFDSHHLNQIGALLYGQAAKVEIQQIISNVH